jgi:adenine-specific DNA-methyltransferase
MPTLNWIGKDKIINHHQDVPYKVLNHEYGFSENGKTNSSIDSGNLIINGDNLEALKSLLPKYEGKVNCIYIDPPYNTGNESWVYNDNVNSPQMKKWLGKVVGKESEDLTRHDKWLCMMYPRLKLLHKLLSKDGAIFISCDDNEVSNLRLLMNEIFGNENFRNHIIVKRGAKSVQAQFENIDKLGIACEYLLIYTKQSKARLPQFYFDLEESKSGSWNNHWRGTDRPTMRYEILGINPKSGQWRWSKERSLKAIENYNCLLKQLDNYEITQEKIDNWYKENVIKNNIEIDLLRLSSNGKPEHYIAPTDKKFGHNLWTDTLVNGTSEYNKYSNINFDNPKNPKLIERIINWITNKNSIILDSFAGSGTTAHAVLNLNKQDGGNRKFILIEMENYAETITAERVKRVINGYADKEGTGGSFDYFTLGEPLFDENNNLNENVGIEKIREYVWFTETRNPYPSTVFARNEAISTPFLGIYNDTSYYFIYDKDNLTTLDYDSLAEFVQQKAERYIIYADNCLLPETFLREKNIEFKKIPRDITRF